MVDKLRKLTDTLRFLALEGRKPLPDGSKTQRKDGVYIKTKGKWKRVTTPGSNAARAPAPGTDYMADVGNAVGKMAKQRNAQVAAHSTAAKSAVKEGDRDKAAHYIDRAIASADEIDSALSNLRKDYQLVHGTSRASGVLKAIDRTEAAFDKAKKSIGPAMWDYEHKFGVYKYHPRAPDPI